MESPAPVAHLAPAPALDPRRWSALALLCGAFGGLLLLGGRGGRLLGRRRLFKVNENQP